MRVEWSSPALDAVSRVRSRLLRHSQRTADSLQSRIEASVANLQLFPGLGRIVPEYGFGELRELLIERHRLLYLVHPDHIEIVTFFHGAMSLEDE